MGELATQLKKPDMVDAGKKMLMVIAGVASPLALGGLLSFFIRRRPRRRTDSQTDEYQFEVEEQVVPEGRKPARPRNAPARPSSSPAGSRLFPCPNCGVRLKVQPQQTSKSLKCPKCSTTFVVPP